MHVILKKTFNFSLSDKFKLPLLSKVEISFRETLKNYTVNNIHLFYLFYYKNIFFQTNNKYLFSYINYISSDTLTIFNSNLNF